MLLLPRDKGIFQMGRVSGGRIHWSPRSLHISVPSVKAPEVWSSHLWAEGSCTAVLALDVDLKRKKNLTLQVNILNQS